MSRVAAVLAVAVVMASACAGERRPDQGRLLVVAGFFPIASFTEQIGGASVEVIDLTPAGAEPHDLELTSDALDDVLDADLVIYLRGFQPALDNALERSDTRKVDLLGYEKDRDPHIWLDPSRWAHAVELIGDTLQTIRPEERDPLHTRTLAVADELSGLDRLFNESFADCERNLVVTSHDAFSRMASRYGLRVESIAGLSPEAEPDPRRMAEIADLVRDEGVTTIFTEELVSQEVAEAIADETGARVDVLDPIESEPRGGYDRAMRRNLDALTEALGCR